MDNFMEDFHRRRRRSPNPQPNDRGVNTRIAKRAVLHGLRPVPKRFAYAFNNGLSK